MDDITPIAIDDLHPLTIIKEELETGITVQMVDSLIKKEPAKDELAGPSKNIWIKEEMIIEEVAKEECQQVVDKKSPGLEVERYDMLCSKTALPWVTNGPKTMNTGGQQVDKKKDYSCYACPYSCDNKYSLIIHIRTHTGEKPFDCDVCSCKFRTSSHLVTHKLKHTGERPYKCDVCPAKFRDITTLKNHMRTHTGEKPYVCGVCEAGFAQLGNLRSHERTHKGEKKFVCDFCKARFRTGSHLSRHKLRHTGEKPYQCGACPSKFRDLRTLKNHVRVHTGAKPYACRVCEARFTEFIQLKRHKRIHLDGNFACDVCGSRYSDTNSLRKHKKTHVLLDEEEKSVEDVTPSVSDDPALTGESSEKKESAVDELDYPARDESDTSSNETDNSSENNHKKEKAQVDVKKRHLCFACRYSSESLRDLKMHIRVHIGEKPYGCDLCEANFRTSNLLRRHKLKTHKITPASLDDPEISMDDVTSSVIDDPSPHKDDGGTDLTVRAVEASVQKQSAVDELAGCSEHLWIKVDETEETGVWVKVENSTEVNSKEDNQAVDVKKQHSCFACSYSTDCRRDLNVHIRVHTGEKPYVCKVCDSTFKTCSILRRHELRHTDEFKDKKNNQMVDVKKKHTCFACSYSADCRRDLNVHIRVHTGEKPYVCEICESAFKTCSQLSRHLLRHTGERRYECDVCASRFCNSSTLKNHKRIHTGEKPYVCGVCEARFVQIGQLKRHEMIHTGEKPYACKDCESRYRDARDLKIHVLAKHSSGS